jgi:hypothetical protein
MLIVLSPLFSLLALFSTSKLAPRPTVAGCGLLSLAKEVTHQSHYESGEKIARGKRLW